MSRRAAPPVRVGGRCGGLALLVALTIPALAWAGTGAASLADTAAARAFRAGDYTAANVEFVKLYEANPGNAAVARYHAITLGRLGRHREAIAVLEEALRRWPDNAVLHYHLGVLYYAAGRGPDAVPHFDRVLNDAAGSKYASVAQRYVHAISQQLAQEQKPGVPRRFGVFLEAGFQHDDNVPAAPSDSALIGGPRARYRATGYLGLDHYFVRTPSWVGLARLSGYGVRHTGNDFDGFDLGQYQGTLSLSRIGTFAEKTWVATASYDYQGLQLRDAGRFARSHGVDVGLHLGLTPRSATDLYYRYSRDDFDEDGFAAAFSSRDGDGHLLGIQHAYLFAQGRGRLYAGGEYVKSDADGRNFVMDGPRIRAGAAVPLPLRVRGGLDFRMGWDDYPDFAGPRRRETTWWGASVSLSRWFGSHVLARLRYSYHDEDSNYDVLSYDRQVWGMTLAYVY